MQKAKLAEQSALQFSSAETKEKRSEIVEKEMEDAEDSEKTESDLDQERQVRNSSISITGRLNSESWTYSHVENDVKRHVKLVVDHLRRFESYRLKEIEEKYRTK